MKEKDILDVQKDPSGQIYDREVRRNEEKCESLAL